MTRILLLCLALGASLTGCSEEAPAMSANDELRVTDTPIETIVLGMGCFWGAERRMGELAGVLDVESGYANGEVPGTYEAILAHERALRSGVAARRDPGTPPKRNHAEVVKVTFEPARVTLEAVLAKFWESHDPTQGDRQGNDVGSNYRSAVYTRGAAQEEVAQKTREAYQRALTAAGRGSITTEIAPLQAYFRAEDYHQDYLKKNPRGYCGLGGTGVRYPAAERPAADAGAAAAPSATGPAGAGQAGPAMAAAPAGAAEPAARLDGQALARDRQLVVFEAADCGFCRQFEADVLARWQAEVPVARTLRAEVPVGWTLEKALFATPTIVLFEQGREVSRYTGYDGDAGRFWNWLGQRLLTPEQRRIAFEQGTERPFTGSHLDEKRPGTFVDPVSGAPLFRSDAKFESGTGWPSFFNPVPGALTLHEDTSHGMRRVEVRSASSGIHLGHVFDDGPPPTHKRYCINGNVLKFVPDAGER